MKYFLSLFVLCFSFKSISQESTFEPYKAEYYIGKFKPGKDMGDMVKWANDWAKWAKKSGAFENYGVGLMTPYFTQELSTHDFIWYGNTPIPQNSLQVCNIGLRTVVISWQNYPQ